MLGTDVVGFLKSKNFDVVGYHSSDCDVTHSGDIQRVVNSADVIINCAAYTDVDGAESNMDRARAVNSIALKELGHHAHELNRYVIHTSTDFVYDGTSPRCYTEEDRTNPINFYGKSKLEGERLLQASGCRCAIVRLQWTYGHAGSNFVTKICAKAAQSDRISVVSDQVGSPTYTVEVAMALGQFVENQIEGLFLFGARGYASRYEIAQFIVEKLDLGTEVVPCRTSEFITPAQRPLNSRFDCSKIDSVLTKERTEWKISLSKFLEQIK